MKAQLALLVLLSALLACKGGQKSSASTATPAATPAPPPPKRPFSPSVSELRKVCDGQGVAGLDPQPRDKATAALFVKSDPAGELTHLPYDALKDGYKDGIAPSLDRATLVACIEVEKKKKLKTCTMEALDPTKLGGTLNTYSWEYVVTLRDTKTSEVLSEKKQTRDDKKCPPFHSFTKSEEDWIPPFGTIASAAVSRYRDGK